jgi:hypothetical protein
MATTTYQNSYISSCLCFMLLTVAFLFPLVAAAQQCLGNLNTGCASPGAKCGGSDIPHGVCTTIPLPKGEKECVCKGATVSPPSVSGVINPRYVIAALVYAPPGCAGVPATTKCQQTGLVDYVSGSSMGTKLNIANSLKAGTQVTASAGTQTEGAELTFGFTYTSGQSQTVSLTKSATYEVKDPGPNVDGIDHDQDMFIILINPIVTLSQQSNGNVNWTPGFSGSGAAPQNIWVSELRDPATMNPDKAKLLQQLGFTAADFKTIRCMDPFAGPGVINGPGGPRPDPCQETATENGSTAVGIDTNRYRPTTEIIQYDTPPPNGACPNEIYTLKNDYQTENATSSQEDYSISVQVQGGIPVFDTLKVQNTFTWTTSNTDTTTQDSTQSLSYTAACPSVNYTGPLDFTVYVDQLYGTFAFVPFDPATMEIIHQGTVTRDGKPVAGELVTLKYEGQTYRTYTSTRGKYRFTRLKKTPLKGKPKGTLTVGKHKQTVSIGVKSTSTVKI